MLRLTLSVTLLFLSLITTSYALTVDVFTTSQFRVKRSVVLNPLPRNATVHVFQMDRLNQLQQGLNQSVISAVMLHDKSAFKMKTQQWVNAHRNAYMNMASAIQNIYQNSVSEIPAIVFDHKYTVLGSSDINLTYQIYLNKVGRKHE